MGPGLHTQRKVRKEGKRLSRTSRTGITLTINFAFSLVLTAKNLSFQNYGKNKHKDVSLLKAYFMQFSMGNE